jgi:ribosome-associated protein
MEELQLDGSEYIQLCDLLKTMGLCATGGEAKVVISQGLVKVDGEVELRKRCKIPAGKVVEYNGESVKVV